MDLVENDQPVLVIGQVKLGIQQPGPVRGRLQVEIHGVHRSGYLKGECGLADLAGPKESDGGKLFEQDP